MKFLLGLLVLSMLFVVGCGSMGMPTETAPPWVQLMDRLAHVEAKQVTPAPTPEVPNPKPITVVTQTAPASDPLGGSNPVLGSALGALALAWYLARRLSVAHENLASIHSDAVDALATSAPIPAPAPLMVVPAVRAPAS